MTSKMASVLHFLMLTCFVISAVAFSSQGADDSGLAYVFNLTEDASYEYEAEESCLAHENFHCELDYKCIPCSSAEEMKTRNKKQETDQEVIIASSETSRKTDEKTLVIVKPLDCPLNKEELGRSTWNLLHTMAAVFPDKPTDEQKKDVVDTLISLSKTYPCAHCAEEFQKDLAKHPPQVENRDLLSEWMCGLHNRVNQKLGKDMFDCNQINERWLNGWKDGSCN